MDVEKEVTAMKRVEDRGGTQTATKVLLLFILLFILNAMDSFSVQIILHIGYIQFCKIGIKINSVSFFLNKSIFDIARDN